MSNSDKSKLYFINFFGNYRINIASFGFLLFCASAQICKVWLDQIEHCQIYVRESHAQCGHFVERNPTGVLVCSFCCSDCDSEVVSTFLVRVVLADDTAKVFAWCTGQTASELMQITPDEFNRLPEVLTKANWGFFFFFCFVAGKDHMLSLC